MKIKMLSNAIKFTETGTVHLGVALVDRKISITVVDTGIGMNAEQLSLLFRPFQQGDSSTTRRFGGTGLGLTISRQLARLMGGELDVSSQVGQGSRFLLSLPCVPCDVDPVGEQGSLSPNVPKERLKHLRILIAEDNEVNQLVLQDALNFEGASLAVVSNGLQAVGAVSKGRSDFDLVLMDVEMPIMDGLEATLRLKQIVPELPVVGQTAHAIPEEREAFLLAGMSATITKPIDHEMLIATILQHARRPGSGAPATDQASITATVSPNSTLLLDLELLDQRYGGRTSFVNRLLQLTLTTQSMLPESLRSSAAAGDLDALAQTSHMLKGAYGNLLAEELRALAETTEKAARSASPNTATHAMQLAQLVDQFLGEVRTKLEVRSARNGTS